MMRERGVVHRLQPPDTLGRTFRIGARCLLSGEQFFALGFRLLTRGDVDGDATSGVNPPALVSEWEPDRNEVARPIDREDSLFELLRRLGRNY
jgi:hypothetical protein